MTRVKYIEKFIETLSAVGHETYLRGNMIGCSKCKLFFAYDLRDDDCIGYTDEGSQTNWREFSHFYHYTRHSTGGIKWLKTTTAYKGPLSCSEAVMLQALG